MSENAYHFDQEWSDEQTSDVELGDECATHTYPEAHRGNQFLPEKQKKRYQVDNDDNKYSKKKNKSKKNPCVGIAVVAILLLLLGGMCIWWISRSEDIVVFKKSHSHDKEFSKNTHGKHSDSSSSSSSSSSSYSDDDGHRYKGNKDRGQQNGIQVNKDQKTQNEIQADKDEKRKQDDEKNALTYDYVVVGQGIGGVSTGYWLSEALRKIGVPSKRVSIAAFEGEEEIGGNIHAVKLKKPSNYDGSFGKELMGDQGAQRTAQMTLGIKRRLIHQLGLEMLWSPFEGEYATRGRKLNCGDPTEGAFSGGPYDVSPDADGLINMAFAYGSLCLTDEIFVGNITTQYERAFPNLHNANIGNNEDPSENAYLWLLEGARLEVSPEEPDLDTGNYDFVGFGSKNPVTGQQCTVPNDDDDYTRCPFDVSKTNNREWKTHVAETFRFDSQATNGRSTRDFNYDYAQFLEVDNVGFLGDFREQFAAYGYSDWQLREWGQTNNVFGYLPGGEKRILTALYNRSKQNGVDTFLGERILRVERTKKNDAKFRLVTSKNKIVYVKKFLFLNIPPYHLFEGDENEEGTRWPGADMSGDVIEELRDVREVQAPLAADVLRVLAQWPPGQKAWFWDLFDYKTGNKSFRQLGDEGCFSRTEFLDTPYHRCANHIVPVYTDDQCERIWLSYLGEYQRTGDDAKLKRRVVDEMKASFPQLADNIDLPILVNVTHFKHAWHWTKRTHSELSNADVMRKAAAPLGYLTKVAMIGEAYAATWSGWEEGALRSAKRALLTRFDGLLNTTLHTIFDELFAIFPETDGSVSDGSALSNFAYLPPLFETPDQRYMLDTEKWWPYGPYDNFDEDDGDFCKASKHGLTPFEE